MAVQEREAVDLWALSDLCTPWCIHVVATLRIAEHLAAGLSEISALASAAECDAVMLQMVLRRLVSRGVFEEPTPGRFVLNEAARGLLAPDVRFTLGFDGFSGRIAHAWSTLPDLVTTGRPAYDQRFGRPFWDDLEAHPELRATFDELMGPAGHGSPDPEVLLDGDWSAVRHVVDVGGGTGALLAEIVRARPGVHGTLVDLPGTAAGAQSFLKTAGLADRTTVVGQSFFEPLPVGADLYLLSKILSNWPDRELTVLLRRCAEAAGPSGRIVFVGDVALDGEAGGLTVEIVLLGGRHRTLDDVRPLAEAAGLEIVAAGRQASGRSLVECRSR
jgi:hypothetical protein